MPARFIGGTIDSRSREPGSNPSLGEIGLNQFAPYLLNLVAGQWNVSMSDELKAFDTTTPVMRTLAVLNLNSGLTINQIAALTVTEQSTMSRTLDIMEQQGLIQRQARASDMRVREVHITAVGREQFSEIWPAMYARFVDMFADISAKEYREFVTTLHKIIKNLERSPASE